MHIRGVHFLKKIKMHRNVASQNRIQSSKLMIVVIDFVFAHSTSHKKHLHSAITIQVSLHPVDISFRILKCTLIEVPK